MKKVFVALSISLIALTSSYAQTARPKITIATGVDPSLGTFYVAKAAGFFEKNGLDVQLNTGSSGSAMVPFLIKNQVQAVLAAEQAGLMANSLDSDVVVAAEGMQMIRYYGLVAKDPNATIETLKGKKIGVALGSASEVFWMALVEKLKLTAADYTIVQVEPPEMLAALQRGDIDAFAGWEPWVTKALTAIPGSKNVRDNEGIITSRNYVYINRSWARQDPAAARAFMRSLTQASDFIEKDPQAAAGVIATYLKLDPVLTRTLIGKVRFQVKLDESSIDYLKTVEKQLIQSKRLKKPTVWAEFIDTDLLKQSASVK
jgi:ABC-type nitrate/sulfonate/bicarbonate transport system substrate-binding protein